MTYLRPDAKSQVTIEYDEQTHRPLRVHTIVVSTQHDDFIPTSKGVTEKMAEKRMQEKIREARSSFHASRPVWSVPRISWRD